MGIKKQVKSGKLSVTDAMNQISPQSKTYAWCERRFKKNMATRRERQEAGGK